MRKPVLTFVRRSSQVAILATIALSLAHAQRTQPAISLDRSPQASAASDPAYARGGISESAAIKENFRSFTTTKVGHPSVPEIFNFQFHSTTEISAISTTKDFRVSGGTCIEHNTYAAGDSCNVEVVFTPKGPGHRAGQLSIAHSASATPFLTPLGGTGFGPAIQFIPSLIATVAGTFTGTGTAAAGIFLGPQGISTDGGDNLYVADTGDNLVYFEDSSGNFSVLAGGGTAPAVGYSGFGSGVKLNGPRGVGVDYTGTVYFSDTGDNIVIVRYIDGILNTKIGGGATGSSCSYTSPCLPYNVAIPPPFAIATDPDGNVYTTEQVGGNLPGFYIAETEAVTNNYYLLNTTAYNYYSTSPSIAVDAYGDLFYTYEDPGGPLLSPTPLCYILEQNVEYSRSQAGQRFWTVAGSGPCGFSGDGRRATGARISTNIGQFAFDAAGNFYFADTGNNRIRRIEAVTGIIRTIAGSGANGYGGDNGPSTGASIQAPTGLAVDSTGHVYTTAAAAVTQNSAPPLKTELREFGTTGALNFAGQTTSTPSVAKTVRISNVGNDTLNFTRVAITSGNKADFTIDPDTTSCNFTAPLLSGHTCVIGIIFKPTAVGARAAIVTMLEDTPNGIHRIQLTGTGTAAKTASAR
jgi:hypothetical protein